MVALHTSTLEAVDASIHGGLVGHALIDLVSTVVVHLAQVGLADDGMHAPDVAVEATVATAVDHRSKGLVDTTQGHSELGSVVGEEQITAIGSKCLQGLDGSCRHEVGRQILPSTVDAYAVGHHPASRLLLDVQLVDGGRCNENTLAGIDIVLLEPGNSVALVGRARLIVARHEHGNLCATLLSLVGDIETDGLSVRQGAIGKTGLDGIGHLHIRGRLLDEVAGLCTFELNDIYIILDNLDAYDVAGRILPVQGHLARALRVVVRQRADSTFTVGRRAGQLNVRTSRLRYAK